MAHDSVTDAERLHALVKDNLTDRMELWREEGRREILNEIASIDPYGVPSDSYCRLCGQSEHAPDCLWVRAVSSQPVAPASN